MARMYRLTVDRLRLRYLIVAAITSAAVVRALPILGTQASRPGDARVEYTQQLTAVVLPRFAKSGATVAIRDYREREESNSQCITRLLLPSYPYVARTSNSSDATVRVAAQVNSDGSVKAPRFEVLTKSPSEEFFRRAVDAAVKASQFSSTCGGLTVRLTFRFKMGSADAVWFEYPGTYEITARPPVLNRSKPGSR